MDRRHLCRLRSRALRADFGHGVLQRRRGHWLGDVAVHARVTAGGHLLGKHLRRQRQDGYIPLRAGERADPPRRFDAVNAGHADIHKHDIKLTLRHGLDRFGAARHTAHRMPGPPAGKSAQYPG